MSLAKVVDPALQGEVECNAGSVGGLEEQVVDHPGDRAAGLRAEPASLPFQVSQLEVSSTHSSPAGDEPVGAALGGRSHLGSSCRLSCGGRRFPFRSRGRRQPRPSGRLLRGLLELLHAASVCCVRDVEGPSPLESSDEYGDVWEVRRCSMWEK